MKTRCDWAGTDSLYVQYHDTEWGVPCHDDQKLFEFLLLEGAQAGLSWITILKKRENYRIAFDSFSPTKIAAYDAAKTSALLSNKGIIRNRLKIGAAIRNAGEFLSIQREFGSFDAYIWRFTNGNPITNHWERIEQIPSRTIESAAMSKDLLKRGFKFVGPTICYAFMQAMGLVNDHTIDCYRHREISRMDERNVV